MYAPTQGHTDEELEQFYENHGLGDGNGRGERLIQFCERNNLVVTNTFFQHPPRKLYTWKSPGDVTRSQIDYVLISQRFKNSVKQAKACPGADINSDHNPVKVKVLIKLKRTRITSNAEQLDLDMLKQDGIRLKYNVAIKTHLNHIKNKKNNTLKSYNITMKQWKGTGQQLKTP